MKKVKINTFRKMKERGEKIAMVTCFSAPSARIAAEAGADMLLVGDSLAMTVMGYENTLKLTMDEAIMHCASSRRGAPDAFIVGDMPFLSWQVSEADALRNAGRFLCEGGADAVKLEGGAGIAPLVSRLVDAGIPVMGHIGILPQKILTSGGYFVPGRTEESAERLFADAEALQKAGAFSLVLECVPAELSGEISRALHIPTIGIGGGAECDGQVQVLCDVIGMGGDFLPKHAKRYAEVGKVMRGALSAYVREVKDGKFPTAEHSF